VPGVSYDSASKGAQAYIAFGAEMVERIKTM
jgi:chromosome partitioning protein